MKKSQICIFIFFVVITGIFCIWFFLIRNSKEEKMILQGNVIIEKIEFYMQKNNKLPNSLEDIGIEVKTETEPNFYYTKIDSSDFILSFGTTLGESMYYYSDSKQWEKHYRTIKQ